MGYLWTKQEFEDFELHLEYKLSEGANSHLLQSDHKIRFRKVRNQLMDNTGFQKKAKKFSLLAN